MARKKGGLNPEVQDDGGLFGDQMLVYEDDLKKAEETPARKKSAGGRVAKASAEAPVQTPLLPEVEESVEVQADEPVQETAPEESSAREIEEDVTEEEFPEVARELWKLLGRRNAWVYLKGGHLEGESAYDLLFNNVVSVPFTAPRVPTKNTHGTGCTLSSAIAAFLPQSVDVPEACRRAKEYLTGAVRHAGELDVGHGHGPTNHFWRLWKERV